MKKTIRDDKYGKTMFPWVYVDDKENLWRKYTLKECGFNDKE